MIIVRPAKLLYTLFRIRNACDFRRRRSGHAHCSPAVTYSTDRARLARHRWLACARLYATYDSYVTYIPRLITRTKSIQCILNEVSMTVVEDWLTASLQPTRRDGVIQGLLLWWNHTPCAVPDRRRRFLFWIEYRDAIRKKKWSSIGTYFSV